MDHELTRRELAASAVAVAAGLAGGAAALGAEPVVLGTGPHLLLDDALIESSQGLERVVTPPDRLPEPVVTGPVDKCFQPYVSVLREAGGRFRIWYGVPESASQSHLATMTSADGIRWERPHRVLADPGHIQFGVSILDDGVRERDPVRRFKYGYWDDGGLQIATSPDGLAWTRMAGGPVIRHDHDINSIHWDPIRKRYTALVSSYTTGPTWAGQRRIPMQSVSDDLVHWREPWRIITPDDEDPGETQFYCMSGLLARGGLLIGLVKVLRDDLKVENAPPGGYGLGYTTLAWSRDGERWTRDRTPFMDRNARVGAWDHAMTWGDCQLLVGDRAYIYYGGYARGHKVERFTERQIGLARMPRDRYVARQAGEAAGTLRTPPLLPSGASLTVNAAVDGELTACLLDAAGKPLPGYSHAECVPVRGDGVAQPLRWRRHTRLPAGKPMRLELRLRRGKLWALDMA